MVFKALKNIFNKLKSIWLYQKQIPVFFKVNLPIKLFVKLTEVSVVCGHFYFKNLFSYFLFFSFSIGLVANIASSK